MCHHNVKRAGARLLIGVALALVLTAWGCGPIGYVHNVVLRAQSSVAQAKTNEADKHAPYEYYAAEAYLKQARIRAGFGDFQTAIVYGRKSTKMAKKAVKLTKKRLEEKGDVGSDAAASTIPKSETRAVETPPETAEKPRDAGGE